MDNRIIKINEDNYPQFSDMVHWRMTGEQREPLQQVVNNEIILELQNPNLYVYAIQLDNKLVGWISIIYMPKIGKFNGHGHIYIDELWVEPSLRGQGFAKALMKKAEEVAEIKNAFGMRLYVNAENQVAQNLYKKCGYSNTCTAYLMEKNK